MTENLNGPTPDDKLPDDTIPDDTIPDDTIPEYGSTQHGSTDPQADPQAQPTADPKAAWNEAGDRLSGLGSKLRRHYEEQAGTSGAPAGPEVKDAAKKLGEAVQNAFEAFGSAAKDPEVKDDVRKVGRSVSDALAGTLAGLSGELRKTFGREPEGDSEKRS